jgi:hypothetical protein
LEGRKKEEGRRKKEEGKLGILKLFSKRIVTLR